MYRRNADGKLFLLTNTVEIFMGMINWHDGPRLDTEYTLVSVNEDTNEEKEEVVITDVYNIRSKLNNQFTKVQSQSASTISCTNSSNVQLGVQPKSYLALDESPNNSSTSASLK